MKRFMILATAALLTTGAFAQTATVQIAPEQRTKIKQYVVTQKVAPVTVKEKIAVGSTLPADVRLSLGSAGFDAERGSQPLPGLAEAAPKGGSDGLRPLR